MVIEPRDIIMILVNKEVLLSTVNALFSDRSDPDGNSKYFRRQTCENDTVFQEWCLTPNICSEFHIWKIRLFCVFVIRFVTDYLQKYRKVDVHWKRFEDEPLDLKKLDFTKTINKIT